MIDAKITDDFKYLVEQEVRNRRGTILSVTRVFKKVLREMGVDYNQNDGRYSVMTNDIFEKNGGQVLQTSQKGKIYKFPPLKERKK